MRDLNTHGVHPAFPVISFGGNALARRAEKEKTVELVADVEAAQRVCVSELRKLFDQLEIIEELRALVLSDVPRMGLPSEVLAAFRALSTQIGWWPCSRERPPIL